MPHGAQIGPPQSVSVSPLFVSLSLQLSWQVPAQAWPTQSLLVAQALPGPQAGHSLPPQSLSVSAPFLEPSPHDTGAHRYIPVSQTPLEQSVPERHSTQAPRSLHLAPPPSVHCDPVDFCSNFGTELVQLSTVHSRLSLGGSLVGTAWRLPCPSQMTTWQSPGVCVMISVS